MNKMRFDDLHDVVRDKAVKLAPVDLIQDIKRYGYMPSNGQETLTPFQREDGTAVGRVLNMTDHALRQLCSRIGVPYEFMGKCPQGLRLRTINHFIQNGELRERYMLRTTEGNNVRAIMSERFTPFDDSDLFDAIETQCKGATVETYEFGKTSTHLRLTFPETETEMKKGDVVKTGLHITNSEVGLRSVTVHALVYRLVCTNGLIAPDGNGKYGSRHIGKFDTIKEGVRSAIEEAKYSTEALTHRFRESMRLEIENPIDEMEQIAKDNKLTQERFKEMLNAYTNEPDPTVYGVTNAITRSAQKFEAEARYSMERLATNYLSKNVH